MKAFIGHSFDDKDSQVVDKITKFLDSAGIECLTGEKAQNKSIAEKVKERILKSDIFLAIFTCDKEVKVKKGFLKKEISYTTSNWVIQESGFAIGNGKELIFLVENGIYKFPELQGDLEIIYFNRKSLDETYLKLTQMIESVKSKKSKGVSVRTEERTEDLEKKEAEKQEEIVKEQTTKEREQAFIKFYDAAFKQKDYSKLQEIYDKELEPMLEDNEKILWRAITLRFSHQLGDTTAFDKLLEQTNKNRGNPEVIWQLALRYQGMQEYHKAKDEFLFIKDLYDINKEADKKEIVDCYKEASSCLVSDGKYDEAIALLSGLLYEPPLKAYKASVLTALAKIAKDSKDVEKFFIYAEGSLDIAPSDTNLRFDLAYIYSDNNHNRLGLLHYKKLTNTTKSSGGLNNLGVEYDTLKLPAKSIESYLKASELQSTISMANIAFRYLKQGFVRDAERIINNAHNLAKEGIEVHGNIGSAKNELDKILKDEDNEEKKILLEAEKEREFRVRYSEAFCSPLNVTKEKLEAVWETQWGDLRVQFDESTRSFIVDEIRKVPEKESVKNQSIKISGKIENLSGRYKIEVNDLFESAYFPSRSVYEATGYLIVSENCSEINVMEKEKDEKLNIYTWKKKG